MISQLLATSRLEGSTSRISKLDVTIVSCLFLLIRLLVFCTDQLVDIFHVRTFVHVLDLLYYTTVSCPQFLSQTFLEPRLLDTQQRRRTLTNSRIIPTVSTPIDTPIVVRSPSLPASNIPGPITSPKSSLPIRGILPPSPKPSTIQSPLSSEMSLLASVPPEILLSIASHLSRPSLHSLSLVSRGFYHFLGPQNLSKDETYTLRKYVSNRSFGYQQVCKTCVQLRSFFHFPTTKKGTNDDECLDCLRRRRLFKSDVQRWLGVRIEKCRGCVRWVIESKPHMCLITPARPEDRVTTAPIGWQSVDAVRQLFDLMEKSLPERWLHRRLMNPGRTQLRSEAAERRLRDVVERLHKLRLERVKTRWAKKQQILLAEMQDSAMTGMVAVEKESQGLVVKEGLKREAVKTN